MAKGVVHPENKNLLDYGDMHRVERRMRPEHKLIPVNEPSTGKQKVDLKTGELITEWVIDLDENGKEVHKWVLYEKHTVVDGNHPIHKEKDGTPAKTTMTEIWLPIGDGSEKDIKEQAEKLSK